LEAGADDYVTKPFSFAVLVQRIKALERRLGPRAGTPAPLHHLGVTLDPRRHSALVAGREVALSPTEFRLLGCLLGEPGRGFTRRELLTALSSGHVEERTGDGYVKVPPRKLGDAAPIETGRGRG